MIENSLFGGKEPATLKKILSTRRIYMLLNRNFFRNQSCLGTTLFPCLGMIATERVRSPATAGTATYGIKLIYTVSILNIAEGHEQKTLNSFMVFAGPYQSGI
jgi:hypothetical protein